MSSRVGIPQCKLRAAKGRTTGHGSLRLSQHIVTAPSARLQSGADNVSYDNAQLSLTISAMEALEGRELMSASIGLVNGALIAQGNSKTPSDMFVGLSHQGKDLVVHVTGVGTEYFPAADVKTIALIGGSGNDRIVISKAVTVPVVANGGEGNNTILGGGGNEVLEAGNGNNQIDGRNGSDKIVVGNGNNVVQGGAQNNNVTAGNGNNVINGSKGNDAIAVGSGKDMINGGAGNDSLTGGAGKDVIVGGAGNDMIVAGTGNNVVRDRGGKGMIVRNSNTRVRSDRRIKVVSAPQTQSGKTKMDGPTSSTAPIADPIDSSPVVSNPVVAPPVVTPPVVSTPVVTPPVIAKPVVIPPVVAGPAVSPPVIAPPVVKGPVVSPPVVTPPVIKGPTVTPPVATPPVVTPPVVTPPVVTPPVAKGPVVTPPPVATPSGPLSPLPAGTVAALTQTTLASVNPGPLNFSGPVTQAAIIASEPNGMAIHTVHFNGLTSRLASGDALDASYTWNYGDTGSAFNTTTGWIGAHTYENPGVYTASLTVTDKAGHTSVATTQVTIAADTRRTIYVDSVSGNDSNTGLTPGSAIATFARASQLMGDNTKLLFHNGQSFPVTDGMSINYKNVVIGSYGQGATARLVKGVASGWTIFNVGAGADGVVAQNLVFDSIWPMATDGPGRINARAFWVAGTNFTCENSTFLSLEDGINTGGIATGVLIQGNYFSTQIRAYSIWGEGYDHVYIGNTMTGSSQEHLIRTSGTGVTRLVIEDNNLSRYTGNKGSLELRAASFFYVAGNVVTNGSFRFGLLPLPDPSWTGWGVAVGNELNNNFVNIRPGVEHVAIRDNVINYNGVTAFNIEAQSPVAGRVDEDIRIVSNTLVNNSPDAKFLSLDGPAVDISVENNLVIAPNVVWGGVHAGAIYVADSNLNSFSDISNNVYPTMPDNKLMSGENYLYSKFAAGPVGYVSTQAWQSEAQVHNEQYADVTLQPDVYDATVNGTTAGALPASFDASAWSIAAKAPTGVYASAA